MVFDLFFYCVTVKTIYSVTLFLPTSSNAAYSLSGIGRFDKILPCPHEDEQDQASIKFLMWNIYEIIHIWTAGEDESEVWSSQEISNLSNPSYQISVA